MKIGYSLTLLFSIQVIFSCITIKANNRASEQLSYKQLSEIQWQQDADKLLISISKLHPKPWRNITKKKFKSHLELIVSVSQSNSRADTILKMISAVSLITQDGGDGHTGIWPFQQATQFNLLPIRLYAFSDGIYIIESNEKNQNLVGQKLMAIAGIPIEKILEKVRLYISYESPNWIKSWEPLYLIITELLESLKVSKGLSIDVVTQSNTGVVKTSTLEAISANNYTKSFNNALISSILPIKEAAPMYLQKVLTEKYWYQMLDNNVLYFQYNLVEDENNGHSFAGFIAELEIEIKKNQTASLIVDLRNNSGAGSDYLDSHQLYEPFFEMINNFKLEHRKLKLYALTGRATYSAATNFILEVDKKTQAIFIGEAMGGNSGYYGEPERVILPNSKLKVMIATSFWNMSGSLTSAHTVIPDHIVELSVQEYFSKSDPVLLKALELIELSTFD